MEVLGGAELLELDVDDAGVHRLGDLHEGRLAGQRDEREAVGLRRLDDGARQLADEPAAQLDDQAGRAHGGEVRDVVGQLVGLVGERDAGGEDELAAAEQVGDVADLADVHPAHARVQPVGARDHARVASADGVQCEDVGQGG